MLHAHNTYFSYDSDVYKTLINLPTSSCMQVADLYRWDERAQEIFERASLSAGERRRAFAYLYLAQAEASRLSNQVSGGYAGSLDPVSGEVIALFAPDVVRERGDPYSEKLAELVASKMRERISQDGALWQPLYLEVASHYWPPPPPPEGDPFWEWQLLEIEAAQTPMTRAKRQIVEEWKDLDIWRQLANCQLDGSNLERAIELRATLTGAVYDSEIVVYGAKDRYSVPRPKGRAIIPLPSQPSYPSTHAAVAAAAATILSHHFPDEASKWGQCAQQAGQSRIWAGVHHPIDDREGQLTGRRVADAVQSRK